VPAGARAAYLPGFTDISDADNLAIGEVCDNIFESDDTLEPQGDYRHLIFIDPGSCRKASKSPSRTSSSISPTVYRAVRASTTATATTPSQWMRRR